MNDEKNTNESDDGLGSVSYWLDQLSNGQRSEAARELCGRYFGRLIALARSRLPNTAKQVADEEDVALSAVQSFFRRAEKGEFPNVTDRDGLWALLAKITVFKALRNIRRERSAEAWQQQCGSRKRAGGYRCGLRNTRSDGRRRTDARNCCVDERRG